MDKIMNDPLFASSADVDVLKKFVGVLRIRNRADADILAQLNDLLAGLRIARPLDADLLETK